MVSSAFRLILCILPFSLIVITAQAQTDLAQETIKIRTELVVVDAQVTDKRSRETFRGLKPSDFELLEDGTKQQIEYFSQDRLPLSIILLVDISPSVRPVLEKIREGALAALEKLKPEDEVALMVFSGWTELIQDFTKDRQLILTKVGQALEKKGSDTRIHEAIAKAARQMRSATNPNSRRVILTITDNQGSMMRRGDAMSEDEVKLAVMESGATVCGLIVRSLLNVAGDILFQNPVIQEHLRRTTVNPYADQTGGEMTGAGKDEVNARLGEMLEHLRNRYSLGYAPTNRIYDGKFRKIKLTLTPEARKRLGGEIGINTRQGYYAIDRESEELLAEAEAQTERKETGELQPAAGSLQAKDGITEAINAPPVNATIKSDSEKPSSASTPETPPSQPEAKTSAKHDEQPVNHWAAMFRREKPPNPYAHLVMLDVHAVQRKTATPSANLTREDFEIEDNGTKREITHFSRGEMPHSVILLIDVAGRTPFVVSSLRRNVAYWLKHLKSEDEIALMAFGTNAAVLQDFTKDRKTVARALKDFIETARLKNLGSYQNRAMGVFQAAEHMDKAANPAGRRLIIAITDDTSRTASFVESNATIKLLLESGSVVYAMVTKGDKPSRGRQIAGAAAQGALFSFGNPVSILTHVLIKMATEAAFDAFLKDRAFTQTIQKTGGAVIKIDGANATEKLGLLLNLIHNRYVLGFAPSVDASGDDFHPLKCKLKPEAQKRVGDVSLVTVQGYYARKPDQDREIQTIEQALKQ